MDSCYINRQFTFSYSSAVCLSVCVCVCVCYMRPIFYSSLAFVVGTLKEECSFYIAVNVLVQHDAHGSVCVLLFPVCRAGFYKSTLGNMECSKCPPHSFSHHEGSLHCGCEKNYFRAEGDPASMACTRKFVLWFLWFYLWIFEKRDTTASEQSLKCQTQQNRAWKMTSVSPLKEENGQDSS